MMLERKKLSEIKEYSRRKRKRSPKDGHDRSRRRKHPMIDDLAERLREYLESHDDGQTFEVPICYEAADALEAKDAEIKRLREGVRALINGDEERPLGKRWRKDGRPSKHDTCKHGVYMYELCEGCSSEHLTRLLAETSVPTTTPAPRR